MRCWREVLEVVADHEQNPVSLRDELPAYRLVRGGPAVLVRCQDRVLCSVKQDADLREHIACGLLHPVVAVRNVDRLHAKRLRVSEKFDCTGNRPGAPLLTPSIPLVLGEQHAVADPPRLEGGVIEDRLVEVEDDGWRQLGGVAGLLDGGGPPRVANGSVELCRREPVRLQRQRGISADVCIQSTPLRFSCVCRCEVGLVLSVVVARGVDAVRQADARMNAARSCIAIRFKTHPRPPPWRLSLQQFFNDDDVAPAVVELAVSLVDANLTEPVCFSSSRLAVFSTNTRDTSFQNPAAAAASHKPSSVARP